MCISVVLKSCVEKYILSQLNDLGTMVKDQLSNVYGLFLFHWSTYVSVCLYHICFNYCNFVVTFEIGIISYPIVLCSNLFWLVIVVLNFHKNLKEEHVHFYKEGSCDSDLDCDECIDGISYGHIASLSISSLLIHDYGKSFHLFRSSLLSFINILYFSEFKFCAYFIEHIPKYFILLGVIIKILGGVLFFAN